MKNTSGKTRKTVCAFALFFITAGAMLTAGEAGTWTAVARAEQVAGTWEGAFVMPVQGDEELMMPESSAKVTILFQYTEAARLVSMSLQFDMRQVLTDWSNAIGLSMDALWKLLQLGVTLAENASDLQTTEEYGILFETTIEVPEEDALLAIEDNKALFINEDGTRLKMVFDDPGALDFTGSGAGISECVLNRKQEK
jgi:hypothetical protein